MRKSVRLVSLAIVLVIGLWFAYPQAREWPLLREAAAIAENWLGPAPFATTAAKPGEQPGARQKTADGTQAEKRGGVRSGGGAPVTAAVAVETDMPIILSAPGLVEPLASVAVKPRVDGQIVDVAFTEGDLVQEGQVLFRLDDRLVKAQIRQAEANLAQQRANLKDAEATLERREALVAKRIVTEAATETQRLSVEGLRAAIASGQAQIEMQRTQLDYLIIKAPIAGRTGSLNAKLGANVRAADAVPLVTINQIQPVAVTFALPQSELPALRRALAVGSSAELKIAGETPVRVSGRIVFVDNQVDKQTGTITAKVLAENKDEALWPGQSVEVALTAEVRPKVVSVPATAVLPSQLGFLTWVIGSDGKVSPREVVLDRVVASTAFVTGGLKAGERVVTDGQIRLAPGMSVTVREPGAPGAAPISGSGPAGRSEPKDKKRAPPTAVTPASGQGSGRS